MYYDYENAILTRQESEADDCAACVWLADCRQGAAAQCARIEEHYNPVILSALEYMNGRRTA